MGLRGAGAKKRKGRKAPRKVVAAAWKRRRTRVGRVIAFLESLPITKGILAGRQMRLLPWPAHFREGRLRSRIEGRSPSDPYRDHESSREATEKPASWLAWRSAISSGPSPSPVVRCTPPLSTSCRPR